MGQFLRVCIGLLAALMRRGRAARPRTSKAFAVFAIVLAAACGVEQLGSPIELIARLRQAARQPTDTAADVFVGQRTEILSLVNSPDGRGLRTPEASAIDPAGRLYLCDRANHRVLIWNSAAGLTNGARVSGLVRSIVAVMEQFRSVRH